MTNWGDSKFKEPFSLAQPALYKNVAGKVDTTQILTLLSSHIRRSEFGSSWLSVSNRTQAQQFASSACSMYENHTLLFILSILG